MSNDQGERDSAASRWHRRPRFDVIPAEGLTERGVGALVWYRTHVLPTSAACPLTPSKLNVYVHDGGRMLTTGTTQLADSPIAGVLLEVTDAAQLKSAFIACGEISGAGQPELLPTLGTFVKPISKPDPHRHFAHIGAASYEPWTVGRTNADTGLSSARHRERARLRSSSRPSACARRSPRVCGDHSAAPSTRLLIQLINLSGRRRQNLVPALPTTGGRLFVRRGVAAHCLALNAEYCSVVMGEVLDIKQPENAKFELIVVEEASNA